MSINSQKTKSMLVTGKYLWKIVIVLSTTIDVNLSGRNIEHVTDFKLLGVTLDHDLSFNRQIESTYAKSWQNILDFFIT